MKCTIGFSITLSFPHSNFATWKKSLKSYDHIFVKLVSVIITAGVLKPLTLLVLFCGAIRQWTAKRFWNTFCWSDLCFWQMSFCLEMKRPSSRLSLTIRGRNVIFLPQYTFGFYFLVCRVWLISIFLPQSKDSNMCV